MRQEDLQSKARSELSALKIIGIDPESLQKEARGGIVEEPETPAKDQESPLEPTASTETRGLLPGRAEVTIPNKFHKSPNVIQDIIQRYLSGNEYKVYDQLKRLSWGGKQRVNWTRIGVDGLRIRTGIRSRKGVTDATTGLVGKRLVFYATTTGVTSDATDKTIDRNQMGTVYIIPIPTEGILSCSTLWNSILQDSILPNSPNKEDSLKDSLSPDPVKLFYTGIGQKRISKVKREKGDSVLQELQKEGFSPADIQFAIEWTLKPGNTKEKVHDLSIISHTIGQALSAREAGQQATDKAQKEAARVISAAEEERRRLEGEIEDLRSKLSKIELANLRKQAEKEIAQTEGMKKESLIWGFRCKTC